MAATELILTNFINNNGLTQHGTGSLIINLQGNSTTYMSGHHIEEDYAWQNVKKILKSMTSWLLRVNDNDWSKHVLITLISDAEQELLQSKQAGAKKASERLENLRNKLESQGLKLPLYPTPSIIRR